MVGFEDPEPNEGRLSLQAQFIAGAISLKNDADETDLTSMVGVGGRLVYGFTSNDIEGPAFVWETVSRTDEGIHKRVRRALRSPSYLWRLIWPRWISLSERLFPTPGSHSSQLVYNYLENPSAWIDFATSLDQLARQSRRGKRCAVVLLHTALSELNALHPFQPVYEKVALAARKRGLFDVPSFPAFAGLHEPNLWINYFDSHPNATAHAQLAELLAGAVLDLPKSCWRRHASR